MQSQFNARDAAVYDRLMGRHSRLLAEKFLTFAGTIPGEHILEMGCGTGSLTFAIPPYVASVTAIDVSAIYVAAAQARNTTPTITIEQGDGAALRFPNASFDRALTQLVLQFMPDPTAALTELRRVVRPGGTIAATVWDSYGGVGAQRMLWDIAAVLDPEAARRRAKSMTRPAATPGGLHRSFEQAGLTQIQSTELTIRMDFANFETYWDPMAAGEGSLGEYIANLDPDATAKLKSCVHEAYLAGAEDGPRSFTATAWACRAEV